MNDIVDLFLQLTDKFPSLEILLDVPDRTLGGSVWSLDVLTPGHHLAVMWSVTKGFGIAFRDEHLYGEGADEVYKTVDETYERCSQILNGWLQ